MKHLILVYSTIGANCAQGTKFDSISATFLRTRYNANITPRPANALKDSGCFPVSQLRPKLIDLTEQNFLNISFLKAI